MSAPLDVNDTVENLASADDSIADVALRGLTAHPKTLPPKLFYDATGAALFERITTLPEYYLTRAELEILRAHVGEIAELAGPTSALIEYGSGAGTKVRLLLDTLDHPVAYVPIDISATQLRAVADDISNAYPHLAVTPVAADYTAPLTLPDLPPSARRIAFFPGSTIGNFHPTDAATFLRRIRNTIGNDGALILGVDRVKDASILDAAYDDAAGITAAFNRNVLVRLNRDAHANFPVDRFTHRAFFNPAESRVEMHLMSEDDVTITVAATPIHFDRGESIWTESSYKYDDARFDTLVRSAGFNITRRWTDAASLFWVVFLTPDPSAEFDSKIRHASHGSSGDIPESAHTARR